MQLRPPAPPLLALAAAVLGLAVLRGWLATRIGFTEDEAYYRLWGLAPAMSYLDHPPMTGWMIAAGQWIAGDTLLGTRLPAVVAPVIGSLVLWRATGLLFGASVATRAVWLSLAMPLLAVGGIVMTPDIPSVLFWGLTAWALAELYVSGNATWWLAVGAFAGLGMISKYSNLFAGAGIALWLLVLPANWRWLRTWQLWTGGALAALITLPVVIWNAEHGWASFSKQFGRVVHSNGLTLRYLGELIGSVLGLAGPVIAVLAAIGLWQAIKRIVADRDERRIMLLASAVPFPAYLVLHSLHDRVQANWPAPIYPTIAVLAALAIEEAMQRPEPAPARARLTARWAMATGLALTGLIYLQALHPLVHLPGDQDPTSMTRGWDDLADKVERLAREKGARWVVTTNYTTAAELAFALRGRLPVTQLDERIRYIHLPPLPADVLASPALYVELARRSNAGMAAARFAHVEALGSLDRVDAGNVVASYPVYRLSTPIGDPLDPAS